MRSPFAFARAATAAVPRTCASDLAKKEIHNALCHPGCHFSVASVQGRSLTCEWRLSCHPFSALAFCVACTVQVNSLEMEMLRMISFSLFVQPEQYERYRGSLYSHVRLANVPICGVRRGCLFWGSPDLT